jgi:hypothetical protein
MKSAKRTYIALLMVWRLIAGNMAARTLSGEPAGDQTKTDTNATKPVEKKSAEDAAPKEEKQFKQFRLHSCANRGASGRRPKRTLFCNGRSKNFTGKKCRHGLGKYRVRCVS